MSHEQEVNGMYRLPLDSTMSSAIAHIDYDEATRVLHVTFVKGGSHTYPNVSPELVEAFKEAGSQGKFFNENIRPLDPGKRGGGIHGF